MKYQYSRSEITELVHQHNQTLRNRSGENLEEISALMLRCPKRQHEVFDVVRTPRTKWVIVREAKRNSDAVSEIESGLTMLPWTHIS